MKKKWKIIIAVTIIVLSVIVFFPVISGNGREVVSFRTEKAGSGELELTVTASGNIEPVTKVEVGTQVSGIVKKIYADYNSEVSKGDLLAELDKSTLTERVRQAQSALDNAISDEKLAIQNYNRVKTLYDQKAATPASLEEAENKLSTSRGNVVNAKADLSQAQVNLSYADIYSPISGRVLERAVDEGQTVAASFSTPTLFTIANNLKNMQVEADVDEADIGRIKVGQKAVFTVDTYPGETFEGTVSQIRLEPTVTSNVVTYTVIIDAPNPEEKLFPGMTANISVTTQSPQGVTVPAEALYFNPDAGQLKEYNVRDTDSKGNKVWLRTEDGIKAVAVTAGESDGVRTIIISGVNAGDNVVVGVEKIKEKPKESASIMPKPSKKRGRGPGM